MTLTTAKVIALAALPLTLAAGAVDARTSSPIEHRGYEKCVKSFKANTHQLVTERDYLISKGETTVMYYINGTARTDAGRDAVRLACETTKRGQNVVAANVAEGRFVQATNVRIEVAQQ